MQVIKESTRAQLLAAAREAFFEKGYEAVTMRELAVRSGISLGNIYNYYRSKEDLLGAVLTPALNALNGLLHDHSSPDDNAPDWFISKAYSETSVDEMLDVVVRYRQELKLLLSSSQNTQFQGFCNDWVARSSELGLAYMRETGLKHPHLHTDISSAFMYFNSFNWLMLIREAVQREGLTREGVKRLLEEFVEFNIGGWARLLRVAERDSNPAVSLQEKKWSCI